MPTLVPRLHSGHGANRLIQLDVLRGLAILLVIFRHAIIPWSKAGILRYPMLGLWHLGWTGVDLFFVLSGFLIGGLLFTEIRTTGRLDVGRFLVRRGFKIWPAYFIFLAVVFLRLVHDEGVHAATLSIAPNLIHLQNYLGSPRGITWSLAVEEHFYLALPLFLMLATSDWRRRASIPAIPWAAAVLIVGCTAWRIVSNYRRPFEMYTHLTPTHLRIDGLFFGVLLAYLHYMHPRRLAWVTRYRAALLATGIALIAPMALVDQTGSPLIWTFGFTSLYLGYGAILLAFVYTTPGQGLSGNLLNTPPAAALAWIGIFSYSIYLWHLDLGAAPVEKWLLPHVPTRITSLFWLVGTTAYVFAAIAGGVLASKVIEMPVLALRERLFPPRQTTSAMPAPAATLHI